VQGVEIVADGALAAGAAPDLERPDVAECYPDEPAAPRCGFQVQLRADGRGESQLELFATLAGGAREPLGRILVGCGPTGKATGQGKVVHLAGGASPAGRAHTG
jgi:hypothetical protein